MVGPALLDLTPDTSIIDEVSCSFDDDDNVRGYLAAQLKTSAGTSDKAARQAIAIDLITCPESRWDDLAGAWAAAGIADRSTLAAIVDDGVAAIRR